MSDIEEMDEIGVEYSENESEGESENESSACELETESEEDEEVEEEEQREEGEELVEEGMEIGEQLLEDLDVDTLTPRRFKQLQFANAENAYVLYNEYGRVNGFGVRRSKKWRNKDGEVTWVEYVCNREGFRQDKYLQLSNRKRDHRGLTRCGCVAKLCVRLDINKGVWIVSKLVDDHNHELVGRKCMGMSCSHRKMSDADILMFKTMRKSGISTSLIHGLLAMQSGSQRNLGYGMKQMYSELEKERKLMGNDLEETLKHLVEMQSMDENLFWNYIVADDGSYFRLFWCDGGCQLDYLLFGDVLAFDATYGKNKYKLPLIIFSGVNHHKQTCVFGTAIVSNETLETYIWVLEQFVEAMKGKRPITVITDGDLAIRNAISVVFPEAHHRLCAWHLLRNATMNIHNPYFTRQFKKCMLYDYEVGEFEERWENLVQECGLEDNLWVQELYEKRKMWSTAHIRGNFFAGLRTTSRCEGLHSVIGRYVKKGYNLVEFMEQFDRCLENIRRREIEADFKSLYTDPVLVTEFQALEMFSGQIYSREIFKEFRKVLVKSAAIMLEEVRETPCSTIFIVNKYSMPDVKWVVSYYKYENEINCSCQRMEAIGIPCTHILKVLTHLHMEELPNCLVLERWTRGVKEGLSESCGVRGEKFQAMQNSLKYATLVQSCREMAKLACFSTEDFAETKRIVMQQKMRLREKHGHHYTVNRDSYRGAVPGLVVDKGKRPVFSSTANRRKNKPQRCTICREEGHNRTTCRSVAEDDSESDATDDDATDDDRNVHSEGEGD